MSEEVKRVGRDLAYEGKVIKVYKDGRMGFYPS